MARESILAGTVFGKSAFLGLLCLGFACGGNGLSIHTSAGGGATGVGGFPGAGGVGSGGTSQIPGTGGGYGAGGAGGDSSVVANGGTSGGGTGGVSATEGTTTCVRLCPLSRFCDPGEVPGTNPCACNCVPPPDAAPVPDASPDGGIEDAGPITKKLDCVDLDECACGKTNGCTPLSDSCLCSLPKCGPGMCACGGGTFLGCAPVMLSTCAPAKARVQGMCPQLKGATFDSLCASGSDPCATKCLNEVRSCSDMACSFCDTCDCAGDPYLDCVSACLTSMPAHF